MQEVDESHERRHEEHDRWLAMQSAYAEYRRASEALECPQFADDSPVNEGLRLCTLEDQQRVAFERYLEARMEFLEFHFERRTSPGTGPAAPPKCDREYSRGGSWLAFANYMPVLQAVILLCTTAFFLIREQKHVRDLEAARKELQVAHNQIRGGRQQRRQRLETSAPRQNSAVRQVEHIPPALARREPAATLQATGRKPSAGGLRVQPKPVVARRAPVLGTRSQWGGARTYFSLSLAPPSRQFKRVGSIKIALRSVDARRNHVSLSILANPMQIDLARLRPNQPVWINVGYDEQPLELVIDRIAVNRIDGHLVERRKNKAVLGAGQLRFNFSDEPL